VPSPEQPGQDALGGAAEFGEADGKETLNLDRVTRIVYYADQGRITVEHRNFSARQFITGMHTRGGYDLGGGWDSVWALFVDMVCVGLLLWIATGIYMWWHLPATRGWGWLALGSGAICFAIIVATL